MTKGKRRAEAKSRKARESARRQRRQFIEVENIYYTMADLESKKGRLYPGSEEFTLHDRTVRVEYIHVPQLMIRLSATVKGSKFSTRWFYPRHLERANHAIEEITRRTGLAKEELFTEVKRAMPA